MSPNEPIDGFYVSCMGAVAGIFVLFFAYACGSCIARANDPESWTELAHELEACDMKGYAEVLEETEDTDDDSSEMSVESNEEPTGRPKPDEGLFKDKDGNPMQGTLQSHHENGTLKMEASFQDGVLHGPMRQWHANGQKSLEVTYEHGKYADGVMTEWHDNGVKSMRCKYKNDQRNGSYQSWYRNGQMHTECTYKNGKRHGAFRTWHENGALWIQAIVVEGHEAEDSFRAWDENGTPI